MTTDGTPPGKIHPTLRTSSHTPVVSAGKVEPCSLVIFGITGDLAERKLIPALYHLEKEGSLPDCLPLIGVGRRDLSGDGLANSLREKVSLFSGTKAQGDVWKCLVSGFQYVRGDFDNADTYRALGETLAELEREKGTGGNRLFYLATPPGLFPVIVRNLSDADLLHRSGRRGEGPWSRVIIEKPFGRDLESAKELNRLVGGVLREDQTFRIDHYLGKETVQNILTFRFGNSIFEPIWNRKYIDHVQITAAEEIGVEGRGAFYDNTGVLRDIIQNHLLQVLALCAMEPPVSFKADEIRDEKVQVLRSLRPFWPDDMGKAVLFGQYDGYRENDGVARDSRTPTFTALRVLIDNWRWQGVPFYLRAGKKLTSRVTEVAIHFQRIPFCLFGHEGVCRQIDPNVLVLRIQPDEGICLCFASKIPGDDIKVATVKMDMSYSETFQQRVGDAYERLILDCMRGDATLFARKDEVERSWEFVTPLLDTWESGTERPCTYAPGSDGPVEADRLIGADGRIWRALK